MDSAATLEKQLEPLRATALQQFAAGQLDEAQSTLARIGQLKQDDREAASLARVLTQYRAASGDVVKAREEAVKTGAPSRATGTFQTGTENERRATASREQRQFAPAVDSLLAARAAFLKAADEARGAEARENAAAAEAAERAKKVPATPAPAPTPSDADRIRQLLNDYVAAYNRKDAAAIARLHPTLTKDQLSQLAQLFAEIRSYGMTITNEKTSITGDTAVVSCTISSKMDGTVGGTRTFKQPQTLRLQKRGESWVIVDRR